MHSELEDVKIDREEKKRRNDRTENVVEVKLRLLLMMESERTNIN